MEKRELITVLEKALYLSTEADELYEKFTWEQKRSEIRSTIIWTVLIFGSLWFIAPAFMLIGNATGNETLEFLGNAYFDFYLFVPAFVLPIFFTMKRARKFKKKMLKTEERLIEKEEQLGEVAIIPDKLKIRMI